MRTPVFIRPKNDIRIVRLETTGYAVVSLYASYVETPELVATGVPLTANVVEIKVPDRPTLEAEVLQNFSGFYTLAVREEMKWLSRQYAKVVNGLAVQLPPAKKVIVVEKADQIIREIAHGDQPFITQQDLEKLLKQYI